MKITRGRASFWLQESQFDLAIWLQERPHRVWIYLGEKLERIQHHLIERPGLVLLCRLRGHLPEPDQCMRPEHDFCICCFKPMPYQAKRPERSS